MRTIKYRAWTGTKMVIPNEIRWNDDGSIREINTEGLSNIPGCDRWPLLEFTGLKDKNGVEIFEGDILKFSDWKPKEVVYLDKDFAGFSLKGTDLWLMQYDMDKAEIIGNIYKNPELLKGEGND